MATYDSYYKLQSEFCGLQQDLYIKDSYMQHTQQFRQRRALLHDKPVGPGFKALQIFKSSGLGVARRQAWLKAFRR